MRVFPHRDWPQDSGTKQPRRIVRARPSLEGLEARALLTVTASMPFQAIDPAVGDLKIAVDVSGPADTSSPRTERDGHDVVATSIPWRNTSTRPDPVPTAVDTSSQATDPKPFVGPTRWVIDSVTTLPPAFGAIFPMTEPKATVDETEDIHDTLENAQIIPQFNEVQIRGTTIAGSSADVYCVPIDANMSSMTVSLITLGATARGEKHLQFMDDEGNVYGDIILGAPHSSLSISIHPRIPKSERMLYLGVFSTSKDELEDSTPDLYDLSIIQQLLEAASITPNPSEQTGLTHPAAISTSPLSNSVAPLIPTASESSVAQSVAPVNPESSASMEIASVVNQTSVTMSLPKLVVAPDGGILSMGEGIAASEQKANAVDLALIDLDSPDEEQIDPDSRSDTDGQDDWGVVLSRPATGLPIAMPTLEEYTPKPRLVAKNAPPVELACLPPPRVDARSETSERKAKRWGLLQTGVGIASAVAFALLMPDATLMLHDPKFRVRRQSQEPAKAKPD